MRKFGRRIQAAFHQPDTTSYRVVEGVVWALILVSVALFVVDLVLGDKHRWSESLIIADWIVLGLFGIEILIRIVTYQPTEVTFFQFSRWGRVRLELTGRLKYVLQPMNLIDLMTVLALVPALRGLRALRLLRLLRTVKFFQYASPFHGLARAFQENRLLYTFAFSIIGGATLLGGVSLYLIERDLEPSKVHHVADGLWWALVTLTTVGYGDIHPVSPLGKIVGGVMMVAGLFSLALFAVIVVGSRAVVPQQADANTILTTFTIRSYLKQHALHQKRVQPLYVVAEVLDSENVIHAQAAGADEVIESTRLGFSMLAHAIVMRGSATIFSRVLSVGAQSLYVGRLPGEHDPGAFGQQREKVKKELGALLLGAREVDGTDRLNPEDSLIVTNEMLLIYLAEAPLLPPA